MGLFNGRAQRPVPEKAKGVLNQIPKTFKDDGCSNSPDDLWGFDFGWACRIHDWRYCTRCHPAGSRDYEHRQRADRELRENLRTSLPWRWRWVSWIYWRGVQAGGGFDAWNSCGPEDGDRCRHNRKMPRWMVKQAEQG